MPQKQHTGLVAVVDATIIESLASAILANDFFFFDDELTPLLGDDAWNEGRSFEGDTALIGVACRVGGDADVL